MPDGPDCALFTDPERGECDCTASTPETPCARCGNEALDSGWQDSVGDPVCVPCGAAAQSTPEPRSHTAMLRDLLAVVHGDGGHRQDEVGLQQAYTEALSHIAKLMLW